MKINMLAESYINFEKAFQSFYDTKPLFGLVDDIAKSMTPCNRLYFRLPAKQSKDD